MHTDWMVMGSRINLSLNNRFFMTNVELTGRQFEQLKLQLSNLYVSKHSRMNSICTS
uniref:Uncharacterized protein n=1 Tax=Arundo donax TaxID=35708 RepID=A0A0A9G398_ARUDO